MITVEELIISSLYHRLVLITIRRSPAGVASDGTDEGSVDGGPDLPEGQVVARRSRRRSGKGEHGRASSQECYSETVVVAPAFATIDASELDSEAPMFASAQGLGYLYLGQLLPQLRTLGSPSGGLPDPSDPRSALISSLGALDPSNQIQITRNVRTISEDADTKLTHALVHSTNNTEGAGSNSNSLWSFENVSTNGNAGTVSTNPLVDMRSHDQFSIIRIEDKTDPNKPGALTMIQASNSASVNGLVNGSVNGAVNGAVENGDEKSDGINAVKLGRHGGMFVEGDGGTLVYRECYSTSSGYESYGSPLSLPGDPSHMLSPPDLPATSEGFSEVHGMDSGVWEMMNASLTSPNIPGATVYQASPKKQVDLFRSWNETSLDEDEALQAAQKGGSEAGDLQGTYKMYHVNENVGNVPVKGATSRSSHVERTAISHVDDEVGLADALKPAAEVGFVIHRVEHPSVRFGNHDSSRKTRDYSQGLADVGCQSTDTQESGAQNAGSRIERLCAEIQNLTASEQASLSELCAQIPSLRGTTSPGSPFATSSPSRTVEQPKHDGHVSFSKEGSQNRRTFEEEACDDDVTMRWRQAQRLTEQSTREPPYRDIVEVTSVAGHASLGASLLRKDSRSKSRRCKSARTSPRRLSTDELSHFEYGRLKEGHITRSACASPTRLKFAIDSPDVSESPMMWRGSARGSYDRYLDGSASTTTVGSCAGRLHEQMFGAYEPLEFRRHTDWMRDLPLVLQRAPLSAVAIPGSHISVAIDRDMRVDMDFSKCNYEMAGFLRRLPNLAIFNDFRAQMKAIWKAWMPKQCLSIKEQLEAGVRYLDVRVTKYLSAFYGEHGLYTRQLRKYLKEVRLFMAEHPREVIIVHFELSSCLDKTDKRRLVTVLFQIFGSKMACSAGSSAVPSLEWLWSHGKQLLVYFPHADVPDIKNHIFGGLVWSDDTLDVLPLRRQSVEELIQGLDECYPITRSTIPVVDQNPAEAANSRWSDALGGNSSSSPVKLNRLPERLHVTKAVLAPDMTMVFGRFEHRSMRELAQHETCGALGEWLEGRQGFNVVALDFVGMGGMIERILEMNKTSETLV